MKYMKLLLPLGLFFIMAGSCSNKSGGQGTGNGNGNDSIPPCLARQIESFSKKGVMEQPIQIDEYTYKGKRTFLFTADCCDQFNTLYSENCEVICAPSGGLEGGGDHKCEDFSKESKLVKLIWKKKE